MEQSTQRWHWRHVVLWLLLAGSVCWWRGPGYLRAFEPEFHPSGHMLFVPDFFQDWASARNRFNGLPIYALHEITLERYLHLYPNTSDPYFIAVNAHPPPSVLLALPFAGLNFADSFALWNILSLVSLAASAWLILYQLGMPFSLWDLLPAATLLLLCHPFWHQMVHGQMNFMLLLLLTGTWAADRTGRPIWAGVLLAVAAAIKIYPAFLLLYFVLLGRWPAVATCIITLLILTALTALTLGLQAYHDYLLDVLPQTSLWRSDWHNLSLSGVWFKLFDVRKQFPPIELHPVAQSPTLALLGAACTLIGVSSILAWILPRMRAEKDMDLAFSLTMIGMLLVSPITWDHYLLLLTLPAAALWQCCTPGRIGRETLIACLFILWWDPSLVAEHCLLLLDAEYKPIQREWIATPSETLTALSVMCYALLGLFVLGLLLTRTRKENVTAAGAQTN